MSGRVLLVEGEELIADMVRLNLEESGFSVVWAPDRAEALQATGEAFDAVLLDLDRPEGPDIELLAGLRARCVSTPVLAVSASEDVQVKVQALDAGADGYLKKPFEVPEMIARLKALIRRL